MIILHFHLQPQYNMNFIYISKRFHFDLRVVQDYTEKKNFTQKVIDDAHQKQRETCSLYCTLQRPAFKQ